MERANRGDEARKRQSPSTFTGFGPNTTSTKINIDNMGNVHNVVKDNPSFDMNVSANEMSKMGQDTLAANLEFESDPMFTKDYLKYLENFKTGQTSTASKYPDSSIINTAQSLAFLYPGMETGQNFGYNLGGMANPKPAFVTDQQLAMPYPELAIGGPLGNYSGGWVDYEAAMKYLNAVKTDPALAKEVGKYVRKPSFQEVANYYEAVNADRAILVNYKEIEAKQAAALKNAGVEGGYASLLVGDYQQVNPGGDSIVPGFSEEEGSPAALGTPIPGFQKQPQALGLPAGLRADLWPKPLEDFLMTLKAANYTFPEISAKMAQEFGIERSPNVLSKRYRLILARDAEDSGIMQLLKGATPKLLRVLQDEMEKMDPEIMNEELRREVWEELQRKLPKVVRTLALQTRTGA